MHTVHYTKHLMEGNLAGFAVPCEFREPDAEHALRALERLARFTPDNPGRDCVTNNRFYVTFD